MEFIIVASDISKLNLKPVDDVEIGKMYLFNYDPRYRDTLPYYDAFPLIIPIDFFNGGFIGLNFHYLSPNTRSALLESLIRSATNVDGEFTDDTKIIISYEKLKNANMTYYNFQECLKKYLYTHVRSSYGFVNPGSWRLAIQAPLEKWVTRSHRKI
jgi:hypothetical protein